MSSLLSLLIFLPLVGTLLILFLRGDQALIARNARFIALWTSVLVFALSLLLITGFDTNDPNFQFVEKRPWLAGLQSAYHVGVDGISLWFVLLSTLLTPICILASWETITRRVKEYMIAFLVLETMMVGMFAALDTVLFYVFFEGVLIPMFIIIGIWGGPNRIYATFKFFLYTLFGSLLMLVALAALYWYSEPATTDMTLLLQQEFPVAMQLWTFWAFFIAFAIKVPMWPVHTWLPDAHVEAPTAGSVILAGVLLKMGGYGLIRFNLPMLPVASVEFAPYVMALSVIAIVYTSLVALAQSDIKKLIAYSSVAHMGFVTLGTFAGNEQGVEGAIFQMISHGVVSGALFLCVGVVYDRLHTREIARYSGLVNSMPHYAILMMIFTLGSVGLPGTSGFVGEFLTLTGSFKVYPWAAVLGTLGIILGAAYMLLLYRRMIWGAPSGDVEVRAMGDLTQREMICLVPLAVLVLWLGIFPEAFMQFFDESVKLITDRIAAVAPAP